MHVAADCQKFLLVHYQNASLGGLFCQTYQTTVPSFGIWGYALAKLDAFDAPQTIPENLNLKFLNDKTLASMFEFSPDTALPGRRNRNQPLDNQALVRYYESEWRRFE
jgi:predicted membrane-bound spermidine synthase